MSRFDAFNSSQDSDTDDEDDDDEDDEQSNHDTATTEQSEAIIPSYDDLSMCRADEETVLAAIYEDDYSREQGVWGYPLLSVHVRPPDIPQEKIGSELTLSVQLGKEYPYVPPTIKLQNVRGIKANEQTELMNMLVERAQALAKTGSVMVCEFVQITENYLLEHNRDPAISRMSAWEKMRFIEAEKEREQIAEMEKEKNFQYLDSEAISSPRRGDESDSRVADTYVDADAIIAVEREYARQIEALDTAEADRKKGRFVDWEENYDKDDKSEDDIMYSGDDIDDYDDYDYNEAARAALASSSSRYKSDFVELGLLGRGGGGEVVKARNRLDRRIYAIKKIVLGSEQGRLAKVGKIQNRKLRREVTTISSMTHKNIVRYYQAWVEGEEAAEDSREALESKNEASGMYPKTETRDFDPTVSNSSDDDSKKGWWKTSPKIGPIDPLCRSHDQTLDALSFESQHSSEEILLDEDRSFSSSESSKSEENGGAVRRETSSPVVAQNHFAQSPPLFGMGFQDQTYQDFLNAKRVRPTQSTESSETDDIGRMLFEDDTSQKVQENERQKILYIQMEYCSTTLRHLIDDFSVTKMDKTEVWRLIRQLIEALVYIHKRKVIHRDLKPSNIFLDAERNVRLGDFGLATTNPMHVNKGDDEEDDLESSAFKRYSAFDNVCGVSDELNQQWASHISTTTYESMTGGVGTTFYRAPEQEGDHLLKRNNKKGDNSYDVRADIFSLGVVLFEMFHPPFLTYMERAETLTTLRGDNAHSSVHRGTAAEGRTNASESTVATLESDIPLKLSQISASDDNWKTLAFVRFSESFRKNAPSNAQRLILVCLQRFPANRPSAENLLSSELLPRKMELEQHYLEEALHTLANPQSESHQQILEALFERPTLHHVDVTFDTDAALKAHNFGNANKSAASEKRAMKALSGLSEAPWGNTKSLRSSVMSKTALAAAASALNRAQFAGNFSIGGRETEALRGAPQRTAAVLAMNAACAAAVTGAADGIHGADPRVVELVCNRMKFVFQSHGAIHLRSPLLRPHLERSLSVSKANGPAEVMNRRGTVLLLPDDLTTCFARSVARGGGAAAHVKRYDIDKVYHKSLAGGHPRESLEASFDIVYDDPYVEGAYLEAEAIMVLCEVVALVTACSGGKVEVSMSLCVPSPFWYIRLTHTRLADSILELCGVPIKESTRSACFHILTKFSACPPCNIVSINSRVNNEKSKKMSKGDRDETNCQRRVKDFESCLELAISRHFLPRSAAKRLQTLLSFGCLPLPANVLDAIDTLQKAIDRMRIADTKNNTLPRRAKRYEDVFRGLRSIKEVIQAMILFGVGPLLHSSNIAVSDASEEVRARAPTFISLDLGLRQRKKHMHGHILFQAITLPDDYFEETKFFDSNDSLLDSEGHGVKIAEGGRYDDLVRKFRPPGNFGSAQVDYYTAAPIPMCVGVRFCVGKFVERAYLDASISQIALHSRSTRLLNVSNVDVLRTTLGHPLPSSHTIRCIVASVNGFDSATLGDRALVAARLWAAGIATEYLPQSGVVTSLYQHSDFDSSKQRALANDWTLDQLSGICALLKIPFVVIVQPHLLKDKGSVRLRSIVSHTFGQGHNPGGNEEFVPLSALSSTIKERLAALWSSDEAGVDYDKQEYRELDFHFSNASATLPRDMTQTGSRIGFNSPQVDCIFVDSDQYYGHEKLPSKGDLSKTKAVQKIIKSSRQRAESFLTNLVDASSSPDEYGTPVVAADVPFWVLREFGTSIMGRDDASANRASNEVSDKYPKHKKVLKNLAMSLDYLVRKQAKKQKTINILLFSIADDRFDLVTLGGRSLRPDNEHEGRSLSDMTARLSQKDRGARR